jgi:hypothetical protein
VGVYADQSVAAEIPVIPILTIEFDGPGMQFEIR